MARPFSLFSDVYATLGIDDGNTVASATVNYNRPISASVNIPKRPQSASAGRRRSISKERRIKASDGGKATTNGDIESYRHTLFQLSREDLINELQEQKKKSLAYESVINHLRVDNQRLERELTRQQQRLDKLLEGPMGKTTMPMDWRKDFDKSSIVRQLKRQIHELRQLLEAKENELEIERKSQKSANLLVLAYERDEYFSEVQRLQKIVKGLKSELLLMKNRETERQQMEKMMRPDEAATPPKISSFHNNLISTLATSKKLSEGLDAPIVRKTDQSPSAANRSRPISAPKKKNTKPANVSSTGANHAVVIGFDDYKTNISQKSKGSKQQATKPKINRSDALVKVIEEGVVSNPVVIEESNILEADLTSNSIESQSIEISPAEESTRDIIPSAPAISVTFTISKPDQTSEQLKSEKDVEKSDPEIVAEDDQPADPPSDRPLVETTASASSAITQSDEEVCEDKTMFYVNDIVEIQVAETDQWVKGYIKRINSDSTIHIQYLDGKHDMSVARKNVREIEHPGSALSDADIEAQIMSKRMAVMNEVLPVMLDDYSNDNVEASLSFVEELRTNKAEGETTNHPIVPLATLKKKDDLLSGYLDELSDTSSAVDEIATEYEKLDPLVDDMLSSRSNNNMSTTPSSSKRYGKSQVDEYADDFDS